jgi:hypothetical protein
MLFHAPVYAFHRTRRREHSDPTTGIPAELAAALLFGAAMLLAKVLLGAFDPWTLAGVLSGCI